jgi:hypothetical protein
MADLAEQTQNLTADEHGLGKALTTKDTKEHKVKPGDRA